MPEFRDDTFLSCNGKNLIHVRTCVPDSSPVGVIQIAHGIAEHAERYDPFASFLALHGFLTVSNDHLGHGKSAKHLDEIGIFAEKDGWEHVIHDMDRLHEEMRKEYPDLPYIFFGHSMGSFLTRNYLIYYPNKYDAAILSGTGQQSPALVAAGCASADLLTALSGPRGSGKTLNDMAFGSYCKKIANPRTEFDWLSRDPETVDKYIADPLCGYVCKVSLYRDMMHGIKFITNQEHINRMNREKPIYFMSGEADPVGDYGNGVAKAYKSFFNAKLQDVMIRLYPEGRHEMLNEINREDVKRDILEWLNSKLS